MVDTFSIVISALALGVSIVSAVFSFRLQTANNNRSTREQLNETVRELIKLNDENNALWAVDPAQRDVSFFRRAGTIAQTATSLSRQAVYLAESVPKLVTDVEFVMIAQALALAGDQLNADAYWQKGIEASPNEYYRIANIRGYADFLFRQGKHELGRSKYQQALKIFDNDTDFKKFTNAFTYQMWMVSEVANGFREEAEGCYSRAKHIFESISHPFSKEAGLKGLENMRKVFPDALSTHRIA